MSLSPAEEARVDRIADDLFLLAEHGERLAEAIITLSQSPDWPLNLHEDLGRLSALLDDALEHAGVDLWRGMDGEA